MKLSRVPSNKLLKDKMFPVTTTVYSQCSSEIQSSSKQYNIINVLNLECFKKGINDEKSSDLFSLWEN